MGWRLNLRLYCLTSSRSSFLDKQVGRLLEPRPGAQCWIEFDIFTLLYP